MPRKPRKIGTHSVKNYGLIDLRLDAASGEWSAEVGNVSLEAYTRAELVKKIEAEAAKVTTLTWHPVIEVRGLGLTRKDEPADTEVEVKLHLKRFWVAKKVAGGWIEADWKYAQHRGVWDNDPPHDARAQQADTADDDFDQAIRRPVTRRNRGYWDRGVTHMPYTEETWAALLDIQAKLRQLDQALHKLIGTVNGYALLQAGGALPMLTAPAVADDESEG